MQPQEQITLPPCTRGHVAWLFDNHVTARVHHFTCIMGEEPILMDLLANMIFLQDVAQQCHPILTYISGETY